MWTPPTITVEPAGAQFRLMATSHGRTSIDGERIFRAEPWPRIEFLHDAQEKAERAADELRAYLDDCRTGKRKDSASKPRRLGWWED
jgi:hypothetical protein